MLFKILWSEQKHQSLNLKDENNIFENTLFLLIYHNLLIVNVNHERIINISCPYFFVSLEHNFTKV
jgi:acetone carboxylase gamma subunit